MKLSKLGILGLISLLSYTVIVVFSPLAYPGYNWMTMAVRDLSAAGAHQQIWPIGSTACSVPMGWFPSWQYV